MSSPRRVDVVFRRVDAELRPEPSRVVPRLFLPVEDSMDVRCYVDDVADRLMALPEAEVQRLAEDLRVRFGERHADLAGTFTEHAVAVHGPAAMRVSPARRIVVGAAFTEEYAVEAIALCHPGAVLHPDQRGLNEGQARLAICVEAIGRGQVSSLEFLEAVVGPGPRFKFGHRRRPTVRATSTAGSCDREHLRAVLADNDMLDEFAVSVLGRLPAQLNSMRLEEAFSELPRDWTRRRIDRSGCGSQDFLRHVVSSVHDLRFPPGLDLTQQVLMPASAGGDDGLRDARLVRFTHSDKTIDYRATYTAAADRAGRSRVLISRDLRDFTIYRPAGVGARHTGMALFPRMIGGRFRALCRSASLHLSLACSADGLMWDEPVTLATGIEPWELVQVDICGPPIETAYGWLVLTRWVGPMRGDSLGALLLDLEDPTQLLARLPEPLQKPEGDREGYLSGSGGAVVWGGVLWLPYETGGRITAAWVPVEELLTAMVPV